HGYAYLSSPLKFSLYTVQEESLLRDEILAHPPDILLTNYVMLELILTRPDEQRLVAAARGLRFLVLDELHTYRGRQGADVALLVRRVRDRLATGPLQCVGTSATLAGSGAQEEQRREVAAVATRFFGATVHAENVTGETLRRTTPPVEKEAGFGDALIRRVADTGAIPATEYESYLRDPLSAWIEMNLGLAEEPGTGRLIRARPLPLTGDGGAAHLLADFTGVSRERCEQALEQHLLASYKCSPQPQTNQPPFAFRLHQFISRGSTVWASVDSETTRYLTLQGQTFVPGDRSRTLLPLAFCRECGQEYYVVRERENGPTATYEARELNDLQHDNGVRPGFLYLNTRYPWPTDVNAIAERLPDDWCEDTPIGRRVRADRRRLLPQPVSVG